MARRSLVAVAVAGMLAVTALTGCRPEVGSAAFVGDTRITTEQVDSILDEAKADGGKVDPADEARLRQQIASTMVFVEVAKRYAKEKGYPAPAVDYQQAAQQYGLPGSDPLVHLIADSQAYLTLLSSKIPPAQLTDADFTDTAKLVMNEGVQGTEADIVAQLKAGYAAPLAAGIGVRNELAAALKRYNVSVNPLFAPAAVDLSATESGVPLVVLPLTAGATTAPAVTDLPLSR